MISLGDYHRIKNGEITEEVIKENLGWCAEEEEREAESKEEGREEEEEEMEEEEYESDEW